MDEYIIFCAENAYNQTMMNGSLCNLTEYTHEIIIESSDSKSIFEQIKQWIKKVFDKAMQFIRKLWDKFISMVSIKKNPYGKKLYGKYDYHKLYSVLTKFRIQETIDEVKNAINSGSTDLYNHCSKILKFAENQDKDIDITDLTGIDTMIIVGKIKLDIGSMHLANLIFPSEEINLYDVMERTEFKKPENILKSIHDFISVGYTDKNGEYKDKVISKCNELLDQLKSKKTLNDLIKSLDDTKKKIIRSMDDVRKSMFASDIDEDDVSGILKSSTRTILNNRIESVQQGVTDFTKKATTGCRNLIELFGSLNTVFSEIRDAVSAGRRFRVK